MQTSKARATPARSKVAMRLRRLGVSSSLKKVTSRARPLTETQLRFINQNRKRSGFVMLLFAAVFIGLAGRAYYVATDPFIRAKAELVLLNTELSSVSALARESDRLARVSSNLESVSLGELRRILERSAKIAERAARDFQSQFASWSELRGKIKEDSSTYEALREQLSDLQKMQNDEIVRLKRMLDEAQKPSLIADALNLFLSFVLGVLGSLLASRVYEWWKERRASAPPQGNP